MKKDGAFLVFSLSAYLPASAQIQCLPGDVASTTREESTDFSASYSGCKEIEGEDVPDPGIDITNAIGNNLIINLKPFGHEKQ
jgi:hypothetical protein